MASAPSRHKVFKLAIDNSSSFVQSPASINLPLNCKVTSTLIDGDDLDAWLA